VTIDIKNDEDDQKRYNREVGGLETTLVNENDALTRAANAITPQYEPIWPDLDNIAKVQLTTTNYTLENIRRLSDELARYLHTKMERWKKQNSNLRDKTIASMTRYCTKYEADCKEFNADIGSLDEFTKLLRKLEDEDLPRHYIPTYVIMSTGRGSD